LAAKRSPAWTAVQRRKKPRAFWPEAFGWRLLNVTGKRSIVNGLSAPIFIWPAN